MDLGLRDKILMWLSVGAIIVGLVYGTKECGNAIYLLAIPWWAIIGGIIPLVIYKKAKKDTALSGAVCALIVLNVSLILFYRSTDFIVGRLICTVGCVLFLLSVIQFPSDNPSQ